MSNTIDPQRAGGNSADASHQTAAVGPRIGRRSLLFGAAGVLGVAAGSALSACSSDATSGSAGPSRQSGNPSATGGSGAPSSSSGAGSPGPGGSSSLLPTRKPLDLVKPDIAPANEYCLPGYHSYPNPAVTGVPDKVGNGESISAWSNTYVSVAPPMDQNGWWTNLNKQMGAVLAMQWVKADDYFAKFQTMLAGNDLPDVLLVPQVPSMDKMVQTKFADLAPYLAGDAVGQYPMLANFSTASWQTTVFGDGLYGIPMQSVPITSRVEVRTDTLQQLGIAEPDLTDGKSFLDFCRAITDPKKNRYAMVQPFAGFMKVMHSLPNNWEKTSQGFRNEIESERFPDYLSFVAGMWKEGLFHPDSFGSVSLVTMFQAPNFLLYEVGGPGWSKAMPIYRPGAPTLTVKPVIAPLVDGGGHAPVRIGAASPGFLSLNKKLAPDKIKLVLRMLNWTGASFGTKEYLAVQFGEEGHNYTLDAKGQPITNPKFSNELFPVTGFPGTTQFMYAAGFPEVVDNECAYEKAVSDKVVLDASAGLFSDTALNQGANLSRNITNAIGDIIQGRRPVSSWPGVVKDWAAKGGDQIRKEYEALQ
jgi:putative aldouronate transport system substrate-binding protein